MLRALHLAARASGETAPNPMVGAVVLDVAGHVAGEGWHVAAGEAHAERRALEAAGAAARGGTVYVTLEPCVHHGRTPPCVDAIVAAGVERVVVGQLDPDPRVRGAGVALLQGAGIEVAVGVLGDEVARQLESYTHHRVTGRPLVVLKAATTIDGVVAAGDGTSQWITGERARADAHELRRASDAVIAGSGTVLADDPRLTVRTEPPPRTQPLRVVVDARGRVEAGMSVFGADGGVLVATTEAAAVSRRLEWEAAGAEVLVLPPARGGGVALDALVEVLGNRGVLQVLVEGGPELAGAVLRQGLVDRLVVYVGAVTAGGEGGRALFAGAAPRTLGDFRRWRLDAVARLGDDVRLDYLPPS